MAHVISDEKPAIYSPAALFWFSTIFGPLAGGIMAFESLRAVGQLSIARLLLWLSIGCFLLFWLAALLVPYAALVSIAIGIVWGAGLWYWLKKQVPDEAGFPRRSIVKPLRICLYVIAGNIILLCASIQLGL
jgi:hypothetical protein